MATEGELLSELVVVRMGNVAISREGEELLEMAGPGATWGDLWSVT